MNKAGREMGVSYKRAWSLVEEMNAMFAKPLVLPARGGAGGGGAQLTDEGARAVALFRALEARLAETGAAELAELRAMLSDMSDGI